MSTSTHPPSQFFALLSVFLTGLVGNARSVICCLVTASLLKIGGVCPNSVKLFFIAASIPPSAKECKVILGPPEDRHLFNLVLGTLDPIDTDEGAMKRLFNLGYGVDGDVVTAINKFQKSQDLPETKILDDTTRSKIKEVFGQ